VERAADERFVFLTGDLGFNVFEPLQEAMGPERFINAGVAEQNMVSVAAGLAAEGLDAWIYSIAPFCYARPFEQIRNDVALHDLGVTLVGNGGGYGYGSMGSSHHALEDYGSLLALQGMHAFVPIFDEDLAVVITSLHRFERPAYLRLGLSEKPAGWEAPPYAPWRKLLSGEGCVLVAVGPFIGAYLAEALELSEAERPEVWVTSELPLEAHPPPSELIDSLRRVRRLLFAEEHVARGSAGREFAAWLMSSGLSIDRFEHVHARGYPSGTYGSAQFHRAECGLDPAGIQSKYDAVVGGG